MNKTHTRALVISTTMLVAGIAASIAGNLQAINLDDKSPGIGAYISAMWWPLALFGVIEIMLHTPWLKNWRDDLTKLGALTLVGAMAAYISYFHLAHTLSAYGYDTVSRYVGPLAIDAAMAMATMSLNRVGHARRLSAPVLDTLAPLTMTLDNRDGKWTPSEATEMDSEMSSWLDRMDTLATGLDSSTTAAFPLDIVPVSPAPSSNVVKPESVPADAADMILAWATADPDARPKAGQADEYVALAMNVTARTARRWRYAVTQS